MPAHTGGCHCGKVRFEVDAPADLRLSVCNCSICAMVGYEHLKVEKNAFRLLQGADDLTEYRFNTGIARHYFCSHCGIKSFYVPRSHPDKISVNGRCLDTGTVSSVERKNFDGRHWESNIDSLLADDL